MNKLSISIDKPRQEIIHNIGAVFVDYPSLHDYKYARSLWEKWIIKKSNKKYKLPDNLFEIKL